MEEELISVIVPVYNVEQYLPRCLECISSQTYRNIEIILVDDGSTDKSGVICDEYASIDSRTRVIHQANTGLWAARNAGQDFARGKYLFFPDADDYFNEDTIRLLFVAINCGSGYDIAICRMQKTEKDDEDVTAPRFVQLSQINRDELFRNLFREKTEDTFSIFMWNKLFRRDIIKDLRSNPYPRTQDKDFMIRLFTRINNAILIENRLYYWFQHHDSLIHSSLNLYLHFLCRTRICYNNYISLPDECKCFDHYLLEELYSKMLFWRELSWNKPEKTNVCSECRSYYLDTQRAYGRCREIPLWKRVACLTLMRFPSLAHLVMRITGNSASD